MLADPALTAITAWGVAMEGSDLSVPATFVLDAEHRVAARAIGENMTDLPEPDALLAVLRALRR